MRALEYIFNDSDIARALDFLILFRNFEYTYEEFINKCGVEDKTDAREVFLHLLDIKLILMKEVFENKQFKQKYRLNSIMIYPLIQIHENIIELNKRRMG